MSLGKSKAPAPPDPRQTAGAQTAQNVATAIAQGNLNNVNQVTPDGSLTYNQSGTYQMRDPNTGAMYDIPQYTATQTLSPQQQAIKAQQDRADLGLATIGADQTGRIGSLLGTPVDLSNEATEGRLMELGRSRLDPILADREEDLRTSLSNQGVKLGSRAYDRAMTANTQGENDAYNNLLLSGRGQAVQETLTERNQPINEITALLSGSQVTSPNFMNTNPAQLANVDTAGLINQNYQQQVANVNAKNQNKSQIMGGLFGLGAGALSGGYF